MSAGYFDALLRSAGVAAPLAPAAAAATAAQDGLREMDVEHEATAAPGLPHADPHWRSPAQATPSTPAVAGMPALPIAPTQAKTLIDPAPRDAHAAEAIPAIPAIPARPDAPSVIHSPVPAGPYTPPSTSDPDRDALPAVHASVRAALAWVAGDAPAEPVDFPAPAPAVPSRRPNAAAQARGDEPGKNASGSPAEASAPALSLQRQVDEAWRAPSATRDPRVAQEQTVQVTIGAIHLRVDAPAATIAQPAPPRPTAPAPAPARSSLSRRALYRI